MTAVSKKIFQLQAATQDEAFTLLDAIMESTRLLAFEDGDVCAQSQYTVGSSIYGYGISGY